MGQFYPDMYYESIYTISYRKLKEQGIKCLLFDLDNTLVPIHVDKPNKKIKELFAFLDDLGFQVILLSNSPKKRVSPFKEILNIDSSYSSHKPFKKKYKKIKKTFHLDDSEIACIGDQLLTDIWGANKMNFTSILVDPMTTEDYFWTKPNRFIENLIYKKWNKEEIFTKGVYYE